MDGTAMDVLMEYVGWKSATVARRYMGRGESVRGSGGDGAFSRNGDRGGRPTTVRAVCAFTYGVPTGQLKPNPPAGIEVEVWV